MANGSCLNCGAKMSCGCQRRTASDGKAVCASCLNIYEKSLKPVTKVTNSSTNCLAGGFISLREQNRAKNLEKFIKK